ncbi:hypothetical protein GCQ56_11475 [Marinifilum sp. N1E240]|uniref:hypothetical protein n=1 Tax=Marinifilum sp. N1E240 TaxID=2608082 RepID=UPI00128D59A2|nr:hypothetical protein [Marinifilum sp. N1E240]MPQ47623.1 hypothetical protein [Marinifilum sp. N1E240]
MKNRNTKDVGENHIYAFILSNLFLFVGIFFSLNSVSEVAILFYSLSLNLFSIWVIFYSSLKKKLAHYTEYFNNLKIGILCVAAILPVFLMLIPLLVQPDLSKTLLLGLSWIVCLISKALLSNYYSWELNAEQLMNNYRMNIGDTRDAKFEELKSFIEINPDKFARYVEKSELYDDRIEDFITSKTH